MIVWWKIVVGVLDEMLHFRTNPPDFNWLESANSGAVQFEIEPLLEALHGSIRKYSRSSLHAALDAILNKGATVTKASYLYGIKRTSLQHYLKKLNIKIKF